MRDITPLPGGAELDRLRGFDHNERDAQYSAGASGNFKRMPRFLSGAAYWARALLGGLALAALAWGWMSWRGDPGSLVRSASAYARRDFRGAAELARQRLKLAPDDVEAIRLLARATARLGRDAPANALFARLGTANLESEDLFLLGLGMSHAGQKESAGRLWEKGLSLQADHPEMLQQLMVLYAARNRVAEAARLAERLSHQKGWEIRGGLDLGTFRSEMNDPRGSVASLRKALELAETSSFDHDSRAYYRKLLARNLLRIAEPSEALAILRKQSEAGADSEASWLLSRALLQAGAFAEAALAVKASGAYRAEHPLELEPSPYVGETHCMACHRDQGRAVLASRHASTLVRGAPLMKLPYPVGPVPDPDLPGVTHRFQCQNGKVIVESSAKSKTFKAVVDYAFGSPEHYCSLVGRNDQGTSYIFRLSHFNAGAESGWVRTTGHFADPRDGQDYLGKPIDNLDGLYRCLFCHTTDPRAVLDRSGAVANDQAIGCERCHGPGGNHLRSIDAKLKDPAIVNPSDASADGRIRICGQCHSNHQESALPRDDPFWLRYQGTTVTWSRCYTESAGAFDCMSCHDPHHDVDRSAAHYNAKCRSCHAAQASVAMSASAGAPKTATERNSQRSVCPVSAVDGCISCHMPATRIAPLHTSFADHYIRVHREQKPASKP